MVWENVPGAYSSNGGEDFAAVLEEAVRIAEPGFSLPRLPDKQRWTKSGGIVGDGWSVAWRTHDAQYWGVPQRRRRISMVVDFNGFTAGDILFERFGGAESSGAHEVVADSGRESGPEVQPDAESVRRDPPKSGTAREETAGGAENGSGAPIFCLQGNGIDRADTAGCNGKGWKEDISYTLNTIDRPAVCAAAGMSGNNQPVVCGGFKLGNSAQARSIGYQEELSPTLNAECGGNKPAVVAPAAMAFDTTQITSKENGSQPEFGKPCHTLNANAHVPCAVLDMSHACDVIQDCGGISPSLQARIGTGGNQILSTYSMQSFGDYKENEISSSCKQRDAKDATDLVVGIDDEKNAYIDQFGALKAHASGGTQQHVMERMVVRRLTPLECTRLQGFPDGWVGIGDWTDEKDRVHKEADAPKYKALGNSIALPFWRWMFGRMAAYLPDGATLGSLFDGIGGFPLCWESIHGKGTAVWASEIEPFAIAVTKHHFGGNSDVR